MPFRIGAEHDPSQCSVQSSGNQPLYRQCCGDRDRHRMEFLAEPEIELANLRDHGLTLTRVLSVSWPTVQHDRASGGSAMECPLGGWRRRSATCAAGRYKKSPIARLP